jgi:hypothetical protein
MKIALIILISLLAFKTPAPIMQKWVIEKKSTLHIDGKTNISSFRCDINEYTQQDTVLLYKEYLQPVTIKGGITIKVNCFDCHQKFITADLRKTLKADEIPFFQVRLLNMDYFNMQPGKQSIKGWVDITLADVTRRMQINYTLQVMGENNILLTGEQKMQFSDFKLNPPRRLAGLIKVDNEINVQFQLIMRMIQQ